MREVVGHLGRHSSGRSLRAIFATLFREEGRGVVFNIYPTEKRDLPARLSEMFHFGRLGCTVATELSEPIVPLLDGIDTSVGQGGGVDTVKNEGGVLIGYHLGPVTVDSLAARYELWFGHPPDLVLLSNVFVRWSGDV